RFIESLLEARPVGMVRRLSYPRFLRVRAFRVDPHGPADQGFSRPMDCRTSYSCIVFTALRAGILFGFYFLALQEFPSPALGQEAKPEIPSRDELTIVVIHDGQAACSAYPKTFRCPDVKHWVLSVNDVKCSDRDRVEAFIKSEAARFRTPDPKHPT